MKKILSIALLTLLTLGSNACWIDDGGEIPTMKLPGVWLRIDGKSTDSGNLTVALPATLEVMPVGFDSGRLTELRLEYRNGISGAWKSKPQHHLTRIPMSSRFMPLFGSYSLDSIMFPVVLKEVQIRVYARNKLEHNFDLTNENSGAITLTISDNRRPSYD